MNERLRVRAPNISVEAVDDRKTHGEPIFWVTCLGNGSSRSVLYTRSELEELRRRIDAALLVG